MTGIRKIVEIDEEKCDGCGLCVPSCAEGAIRVIDGKARLVSDVLCDGLGACLGECPQGAIRIVERAAAAFEGPPAPHVGAAANEGASAPAAIEGRPAPDVFEAAIRPAGQVSASFAQPTHPYGVPTPPHVAAPAHGCPGSRMRILSPAPVRKPTTTDEEATPPSLLGHWPLKIRLVPPHAPFLQGADLVVAADCAPVALADFHSRFVGGRTVMIGCPKFDDPSEYAARFTRIFAEADVHSVTILAMEVPCCQALPAAVLRGMQAAGRSVPVEVWIVGVDGEVRRRLRPNLDTNASEPRQ